MPRAPGLAALSLALVCAGVAACTEAESEQRAFTLGVAAAPSLSGAFTEIISIFEADNPGVRVSLELGRSNEIADSLASRTDINVFASASEETMSTVVASGVAVDPRVFARNHVVLAVPTGNPGRVVGLADLERDDLRVGLCDVTVPCGRAGDSLLAAARVAPRDVERTAGSRALTARLAGNELDAGVVYRTDVASSRGGRRGRGGSARAGVGAGRRGDPLRPGPGARGGRGAGPGRRGRRRRQLRGVGAVRSRAAGAT